MIELVFLILLLVATFFIGQAIENHHYSKIREREMRTRSVPIFNDDKPRLQEAYVESTLFVGSVVISVDYFKRFLAQLRNIFGGRVKSYESLLDRARREAILRMKEDAIGWGAKEIVNLRLETSSIGGAETGGRGLGSVEVVAYGTGLKD